MNYPNQIQRMISAKKLDTLMAQSYMITNEPIGDIPIELTHKIDSLRRQAQTGNRGIIRSLERYIEKYPSYPPLKNFLFSAYKARGENKKAQHILDDTIVQHPNYLFGKISKALELLEENELDEVPALLGRELEIGALCPDRDVFHVSEVLAYMFTVGRYCLEIDQYDAALEQLNRMKTIDTEDRRVDHLATLIASHGLDKMRERQEKSQKMRIVVDSFPTIVYEDVQAPPIFTNEEIEVFYEYYPDDLSTDHIQRISNLDRAGLISDLELVVEDTIRRYAWFSQHSDELSESEQSFAIHAMYWLGAFQAKESLTTILNMLRQGKEFIDFWSIDMLEESIHESLYSIAHDQLDELKDFVLEPNIYSWARLIAVNVVEQVCHHQPHRRAEVVQWFREVLQFHVDRPDDSGLIDTNFISWTVCSLSKINPTELIPLVQELWNLNWINEQIMGDIEQIKSIMRKSPDPADRDPMPRNIEEYYNRNFLDRRAQRIYTSEEEIENERFMEIMHNDPLFDVLTSVNSSNDERVFDFPAEENQTFYNGQTPFRRDTKIGRNDPCPCNSGKKYKKCCLHN